MSSINIEKYKEAISNVFYTVIDETNFEGDRNPFYCYDMLSNFSQSITLELNENKDLGFIEELNRFNLVIVSLTQNFIEFFIGVYKFDGKDFSNINPSYENVLINFRELQAFELILKKHYKQDDFLIAIKMKDYCVDLIKKSIIFLDNQICLNIDSCPFSRIKERLIKKLKSSFSNEDINTYLALKKEILPEQEKVKLPKQENQKRQKQIKSKSQSKGISMSQLALKLVFEKKHVTRENSKSFLSGTTFTSGDALYNNFTKWANRRNRIIQPDTKKLLSNRINDYEEVIKILSSKYLNTPKKELEILKKYLENY